jgi:hypothetical protein
MQVRPEAPMPGHNLYHPKREEAMRSLQPLIQDRGDLAS